MSLTVNDVYRAIDGFAPFARQLGFDNCGVNVDCGAPVEKILVALDANERTIAEANEKGCALLVSHHPILRGEVKTISALDPAFIAIKAGVSVIAAHTSWDGAVGGVSEVLADIMGLTDLSDFAAVGRIGTLPEPLTPEELAKKLKDALCAQRVMLVRGEREIRRVAVVGGSSTDAAEAVKCGADAFVMGETRHNELLLARRAGLTLIAAGHFETERASIPALAALLREHVGVKVLVSSESSPAEYI